MTQQTPVEILGTAMRLRLSDEKTRRFIRFCVVGVSGFVVNAVLLELFVRGRIHRSARREVRFSLRPARACLYLETGGMGRRLSRSKAPSSTTFSGTTSGPSRSGGPGKISAAVRKFLVFNLLSIGGIVIQFCTVGIAARAVRQHGGGQADNADPDDHLPRPAVQLACLQQAGVEKEVTYARGASGFSFAERLRLPQGWQQTPGSSTPVIQAPVLRAGEIDGPTWR